MKQMDDKQAHSLPISICIPTLCCADLLRESTDTLIPQLGPGDKIIILDNGDQNLDGWEESAPGKVEIIREKHNLGVAGSWNKLIKHSLAQYGWMLILNDDISLSSTQLLSIKHIIHRNTDKWFLVGPYFWSVFALSRDCFQAIGEFDQNFYPAYFEDNDYFRRIQLMDSEKYLGNIIEFNPEIQRNSETIRRQPSIHRFSENWFILYTKMGRPSRSRTF